MKRRALLSGLGAGLVVAGSGCTGGPAGDGSDGPMTLSLTAVDDGPGPLAFAVTVSSDRLGPSAVPVVDIAVENVGNGTANWSYAGGVGDLPFPQGVHDAATGGVVIGLTEEVRSQLVDASDGCSRVEQFARADGIKNTTLEPGERIERGYAIAAVAGNLDGTCPAAGNYRMEQDFGDYGTWGFEFRLE